ncbi:peptidase A1 [Purpureocillium lavendulum]|uniref:Peptidase A1 n=1 Tax=Purpureocillium lavendulum TaxID=1247861 RepID=A0AB34G0N9_9HYPO|nr:peptidase A1 [Purpureocillium lavendulum]
MPPSSSPSAKRRVAYIRTVIDRDVEYNETEWCNLRTWLRFWVGQEAQPNPFGHGPKLKCGVQATDIRHHYILAYRNAADKFVLDWLIGCSGKGSLRLARDDFTVYLSRSQASNPANKALLDRLGREAVHTITVASNDAAGRPSLSEADACEEELCAASDYLLETHLARAQHISPFSYLWHDSLRHGHSQRPETDDESQAHWRGRLRRRMGGHTARSCSYPHPKSEGWRREHEEAWRNYACPSCGKRCKRGKGCRTTGEQWWTGGTRREEERRWGEDVDLTAPRPREFEEQWRSMSVEDVVGIFGKGWGLQTSWRWQSVDTFSGE